MKGLILTIELYNCDYREIAKPHMCQMLLTDLPLTGVYDDRLIVKPEHPFEKPLTLIERLLRIYSNPNDVIFDPFVGSATVALACWNLNRNYIGCEIDSSKYQIAIAKLIKNNVDFQAITTV